MAQTSGPEPPHTPATQRRWQADCPGCGAPVEFQSAASVSAVCAYCRSTVVRDGDSLRRIGVSAELFDDHSPLQLGAAGRYDNRAFTLVGRLQYGYDAPPAASDKSDALAGTWNEWFALFDDGSGGWLSEDNDQYVFSFDQTIEQPLPAEAPALNQALTLAGARWQVASRVPARLIAAQGELPRPPALDRSYWIVDLRSSDNRVATLDYADAQRPVFSIGMPVRLDALQLRGLRTGDDASTKAVAGRNFSCPSCGASIEVKLAETRSITCSACHSVVDLSSGIGGELQAYQQAERFTPTLPLGGKGTLAIANLPATDWQVVGYAVKRANTVDPADRFTWSEYLLFNQQEGFAFLVDSDEGWVGYRTLTGIPTSISRAGQAVEWEGGAYRCTDTYSADVVYVEGEFYWRVERQQCSTIADFAGQGAKMRERLSREESESEVVWSLGKLIPASFIQRTFGLSAEQAKLLRPDVKPTSGAKPGSWIVILIVIFVVLFALSQCDDDDSSTSYGTHGGSYGGFSTAGGHK